MILCDTVADKIKILACFDCESLAYRKTNFKIPPFKIFSLFPAKVIKLSFHVLIIIMATDKLNLDIKGN